MRPRARTIRPVRPSELGVHDGLAYSLWIPDAANAGLVILHGAGSCKESHHDFARAALAGGFATIAFDQRGHGASGGLMDGGAIDDVVTVAGFLRRYLNREGLPIALRGSSMGGYFAVVAATAAHARAVIAICPASAEGLRRGLSSGRFGFDADSDSLDRLLRSHDLSAAVDALDQPLLLLHAEGDEQVPVEQSRELAQRTTNPHSRLIAVPGGHHRSIQQDPELQAISLRWLAEVLPSSRS